MSPSNTIRVFSHLFYREAPHPEALHMLFLQMGSKSFKKKKKKLKTCCWTSIFYISSLKCEGSQTLVLVGDIKRVCCTKEMFEVDSIGQMKTWGTVSAVGCSNIWDSGNLCLFCARRLWNIVTHMHTDSQYPHRSVVRIDSSNYCSVTSGPC